MRVRELELEISGDLLSNGNFSARLATNLKLCIHDVGVYSQEFSLNVRFRLRVLFQQFVVMLNMALLS